MIGGIIIYIYIYFFFLLFFFWTDAFASVQLAIGSVMPPKTLESGAIMCFQLLSWFRK